MDGTAAAGSTSHATPRAVRVFLGDARLAATALNHGRHYALNRAFGVSREQANLLTVVLALGVADGAYATTRRVLHGPFPLSGSDATLGGMLMREAVLGAAGPAARKVPFAGAILTVAVIGGFAIPGLRRAAQEMRATELRVRRQRMRAYAAANEAARRRRETA